MTTTVAIVWMTRVASILLEAAERSFLLELVRDGYLPVIAGLLERGASCPLRTPVPYRAEYAMTEFVTGRHCCRTATGARSCSTRRTTTA